MRNTLGIVGTVLLLAALVVASTSAFAEGNDPAGKWKGVPPFFADFEVKPASGGGYTHSGKNRLSGTTTYDGVMNADGTGTWYTYFSGKRVSCLNMCWEVDCDTMTITWKGQNRGRSNTGTMKWQIPPMGSTGQAIRVP